jgi:hypothetical protein
MHTIPWIVSLAVAVWMFLEARRSGWGWGLWAMGGAVYSLLVTTILLGLAHAATIPIEPGAHSRANLLATLAAVFLIVVPGQCLIRGYFRAS